MNPKVLLTWNYVCASVLGTLGNNLIMGHDHFLLAHKFDFVGKLVTIIIRANKTVCSMICMLDPFNHHKPTVTKIQT